MAPIPIKTSKGARMLLKIDWTITIKLTNSILSNPINMDLVVAMRVLARMFIEDIWISS
jgi:hypothetical protein